MTKRDLVPRSRDDSRLFCRLQRVWPNAELAPSAHDQPESLGVFCRRHQQQQLRIVGQSADLLQVQGLDSSGGQARGERWCQLVHVLQAVGELKKGQRVAVGALNHALADERVSMQMVRRKKGLSLRTAQSFDRLGREPREWRSSYRPRRDDHDHRFGLKSPGGEGYRHRRLVIQPSRIVHQAQQRANACRLGQQAKHRSADQKPVRGPVRHHAQRGSQRCRLRWRK